MTLSHYIKIDLHYQYVVYIMYILDQLYDWEYQVPYKQEHSSGAINRFVVQGQIDQIDYSKCPDVVY